MKQQGYEVDEVLCFILVRLCFNRLRSAWRPGGYPPTKHQQVRPVLASPGARIAAVHCRLLEQVFSRKGGREPMSPVLAVL